VLSLPQTGAVAGQCFLLSVQTTHAPVVEQAGAAVPLAEQAASFAHAAQVFVVLLQVGFVPPQSESARHPTHV
jgi:hypothetical protein